jgi:singapore isolate B (sub-type 7) whole genome shotgun sequence assembly, scaffold_23
MPYNEGRKECVVGKVDRLDVQDAIEYAEEEMTEKQKASLQIYEKNKQQIDTILEAMSEGLVELKVALQITL